MKSQLSSERKLIWTHTLTVLTGQLAAVLTMVLDTVIAGRYSNEALAALSVANSINLSVVVSLVGVLNVLLPIYAEHRGAGRHAMIGKTLHQGLYLCLGLSVIAVLVLSFPAWMLSLAKVPIDLTPSITSYLAVQALGVPLFMLFRMYAALSQALGKPWFVTWLQIAILLLKIPLSYALIQVYGLMGCALATFIVNSIGLGIAIYLMATRSEYKPFGIWRALDAPHWKSISHQLKLGLPAGLSQLVEITSFTLIALLVARLGITAAAAHQIASSVVAMLFMLPISYSIAATSRVSYWLGHGNPKLAEKLIQQTLQWGFIFSSSLCIAVLIGRYWLANIFSSAPEVVTLTSSLLAFIALYHIPDSLQIIGMFLLRCYRITLMPLVVYSIFLWGIGLGGGYWVAYESDWSFLAQSPRAFWFTAIASLSIAATWFSVALLRVSRREALRHTQPKA